jgi:tetraacyldisaccharide 4'-kinase
VHSLWNDDGLGWQLARAALAPAELLFRGVSASRGSLYSSGILPSYATAIPALSVGNLTVGGTGKTPLAAYIARRLRTAGAKPAIVLRGYGEDEVLVHETLNPDVEVVVEKDRVAGSEEAFRRGCDIVVLDDAFQHRRAKRVTDIVVVSADSWTDGRRRLIPAGPWREPLDAARRASLAIITRKAASPERAREVESAVERAAHIRTAVAHLQATELRQLGSDDAISTSALRATSVLAISAIGDPKAFEMQLTSCGATVESIAFRDHHRFTKAEANRLAARGVHHHRIVCTLKDAVKLGRLWPGPSPLWYVSQRVDVESGAGALDDVLTTTLTARSASTRKGRPG